MSDKSFSALVLVVVGLLLAAIVIGVSGNRESECSKKLRWAKTGKWEASDGA